MIAVDLALAVTYPNAGNLGGGGYGLHDSSGQSGTLDFREKAPKKSHSSMYLDENGEVITGLSYEGALSVGVPGTVAGLFEIYKNLDPFRWIKYLNQPFISKKWTFIN